MTRREETTAAKRALIAKGFDQNNVKVEHGTGTASWWLLISADIHHVPGCSCKVYQDRPADRSRECQDLWHDCYRRISEIVAEATGRVSQGNREYNDRIGINLGFFE